MDHAFMKLEIVFVVVTTKPFVTPSLWFARVSFLIGNDQDGFGNKEGCRGFETEEGWTLCDMVLLVSLIL